MPEGYTLRPGLPDDVDALIALADAEELHRWRDPGTGSFWIRHEWVRDDFDPATDAWVIERGGVPVAFAYAVMDDNAFESAGVVHPDHAGRGLGALLVSLLGAWAEARAVERPLLRSPVWSTDAAGLRLFEATGYAEVRRFLHMSRSLPADEVTAPPAVAVVRGADPRVVHRVLEEGFAEHWDHSERTFERWWDNMRGPADAPHPWFDPMLLALATVDDEPVGAWRGRMPETGIGWIDQLAVVPRARRRGVGTALLADVFAALAERGAPEAWLNVDATNESGAVALYESVGMRMRRSWVVMEKGLGNAHS